MTSTLALNDNISSYLEIEFRKTLESILCWLNLKDLYYHRTKFKEKILACLNFSTLRDFPTDNYVKGRLIELTWPQDFTFSRWESIMPDREFFNNLFPWKHFDLYEFAKDTSKIREELWYNPWRRMLTSLLMMKPEYETKYSYIFYYLSLNPSYENWKEKEETEKLLVPNREKLDRIIQLFNWEIPSSEIIETFFSREGLNVNISIY